MAAKISRRDFLKALGCGAITFLGGIFFRSSLAQPSGNAGITAFPFITPGIISPLATTQTSLYSTSNWDFENGLQGWTSSGSAFTNQPVRADSITASRMNANFVPIGGSYWQNTLYPLGQQGEYLIMTDTNATGRLWRRFIIRHNQITFLLGGLGVPANSSVSLFINVPQEPPAEGSFKKAPIPFTGPEPVLTNNSTQQTGNAISSPQYFRFRRARAHAPLQSDGYMHRIVWTIPLQTSSGTTITYQNNIGEIVIEDNSPTGRILVDDFQFTS